ncbi:hypothetical protein [Caulobacter sp.]
MQPPKACHPGRSEAESRDPGADALRLPLGPGQPLRGFRDDKGLRPLGAS